MKKTTCVVLSVALVSAGCATSSADITTAYVSPLQYQSYDCDQIIAETTRIEQRVHQLGGRLDEAAANDKAIVGVGLVLFWPALFALGGTKQQEAEYARMKGEYEALQQTAVQKKCMRQSYANAQVPPSQQTSAVTSAVAPSPTPQASSVTLDPSLPRVPGNSLKVGSKTVSLGSGEWIQLGTKSSEVMASTLPMSGAAPISHMPEMIKAGTTTVVEARGSELGRVVVMSANTSGAPPLQQWNVDLCKDPDAQFSERISRRFDLPECLYVKKVIPTLPTGSEMSTAVYWATSWHLTLAPIYFEVGYAKYAPSGFLSVTTFLPSTLVPNETAALAWGRELSRSMRPLAEGTLQKAYLPAT